MPDILIRGISIPRNCFECPLFTNCDACEGHECGCRLLGGIGYEEDISEDRRRDDCPLVELPEHGDLIDLDALTKEINERIDAAIKWGINAIADRDAEIKLRAEQAVVTFCEASLTAKKLPTIVPASVQSKEETE